jgi:iduronate 2-sulfatase
MVDDLRPQLNCYGLDYMHTPAFDSLADDGVLFEKAYCQQAVCAPSRISMLTGLRPETTDIFDLTTRLSDKNPDMLTLPAFMKQNGYSTYTAGKIFHHRNDSEKDWDKMYPYPKLRFGYWSDYIMPESMEYVERNVADGGRPSHGLPYEISTISDYIYKDETNVNSVIADLENLEDPFFLALGFSKPHLPFNAPKEFWDLYPESQIQLTDNDLPPINGIEYNLTKWGELRQYYGVPKEGPISRDMMMKLVRGYYACVSYIDSLIGRLMTALKARGLYDDLMIVLVGDHGYQLGEHGQWTKHNNFELSIHAPLIIKFPNNEFASLRYENVTEMIDIFPTITDQVDLDTPSELEGRSLIPRLRDEDESTEHFAFSQYPRYRYQRGVRQEINVMGYSVRSNRYRFTLWYDVLNDIDLAYELYDHFNDSQERYNIAYDSLYQAVVEDYKAVLFNKFERIQSSDIDLETDEVGEEHIQVNSFKVPFSSQIQFRIFVSQKSDYNVRVYDILGRKVFELFSGFLNDQSILRLSYATDQLASGSYILRVSSDSFSKAQTFTVYR